MQALNVKKIYYKYRFDFNSHLIWMNVCTLNLLSKKVKIINGAIRIH